MKPHNFSLLSFSLISLIVSLGFFDQALARKSRRYIKKQQGITFDWRGHIAELEGKDINSSLDVSGAYMYNIKGFVEIGPYFHIAAKSSPRKKFDITKLMAGIFAEVNFIKNQGGKKRYIPSAGLRLGIYNKKNQQSTYLVSPYLSMKFFVGKRTAFISRLAYVAITSQARPLSNLSHKADLSMGFAYYFDF